MSEPAEVLRKAIYYRDARGKTQTVVIEARVVAEMEKMERNFKRADRRYRERTSTFTDVGIKASSIPDAKRSAPNPLPKDEGNPWEGPRFEFTHFLGDGAIWSGPPKPGQFCGDPNKKLEPHQYCLDCDRSGRELKLPGPGPTKRIRRAYRKGKLKGGCGVKPMKKPTKQKAG